jgi:hypothetical protein
MRNKKRDRKAQTAASKAILASVSEEMAQPRMAKSVQLKTDKQKRSTGGRSV